MVEIKVLLYQKLCLFHCSQHAGAIITDLSTQQSYNLDFPMGLNEPADKSIQDSCCVGVVTLESDKDYNHFIELYENNFAKTECKPSNNCADAVNFALDYFFPEMKEINHFSKAYQMLCCLSCIGTLGLKYFSAPSCISTPHDIFNKAKAITLSNQNQNHNSYSVLGAAPSDQRMN